jgi:hypothetical protein
MATRTRKFKWLVVAQTYKSAVIVAETESQAIDVFHNIEYNGSARAKQALEDSTAYEVEAHEYDLPRTKQKRK